MVQHVPRHDTRAETLWLLRLNGINNEIAQFLGIDFKRVLSTVLDSKPPMSGFADPSLCFNDKGERGVRIERFLRNKQFRAEKRSHA